MMKLSGVSASTTSCIRFFDNYESSFRGVTKGYDVGISTKCHCEALEISSAVRFFEQALRMTIDSLFNRSGTTGRFLHRNTKAIPLRMALAEVRFL